MTDLAKLKVAAEDCNAFCNKCGYIGKSEPHHTRIPTATEMPTQCGYQAKRMMYVHNATILKLIAVVEAAQEVADSSGEIFNRVAYNYAMSEMRDALKGLDHDKP